jgi:hypothetical protein
LITGGERYTLEGAGGLAGDGDHPRLESADCRHLRRCPRVRYLPRLYLTRMGWQAPPTRREAEDQLDMVPLTQVNSRLACEILYAPKLDELEVALAPVSA